MVTCEVDAEFFVAKKNIIGLVQAPARLAADVKIGDVLLRDLEVLSQNETHGVLKVFMTVSGHQEQQLRDWAAAWSQMDMQSFYLQFRKVGIYWTRRLVRFYSCNILDT